MFGEFTEQNYTINTIFKLAYCNASPMCCVMCVCLNIKEIRFRFEIN